MTHEASRVKLQAMIDAGKRDFFAKGGIVRHLKDEVVLPRGINCCPGGDNQAPRLAHRDEHYGIMQRPENNE